MVQSTKSVEQPQNIKAELDDYMKKDSTRPLAMNDSADLARNQGVQA